MAEARTFYGGDPLTGTQGGELGAGKYDGPEAHAHAPWKCPACDAMNEGSLPQGCSSCGRGKPGFHVDTATPPSPALSGSPAFAAVRADMQRGLETLSAIELAFNTWYTGQILDTAGTELAREAFRAGWIAGAQNQAHRTMAAPPVTVDVRELAPQTKAQRTIIAALDLFKDQILSQATDEITSGEWMSVEEVEELIATLRAQL